MHTVHMPCTRGEHAARNHCSNPSTGHLIKLYNIDSLLPILTVINTQNCVQCADIMQYGVSLHNNTHYSHYSALV